MELGGLAPHFVLVENIFRERQVPRMVVLRLWIRHGREKLQEAIVRAITRRTLGR
jgi:hypothetical protein